MWVLTVGTLTTFFLHLEAVRNVSVILEAMGKQHIPIYRGASRPILGNFLCNSMKDFWNKRSQNLAWTGHGVDGLGGHGKTEGEVAGLQKEHAVNALVRLAEEHPDLHLLCIGTKREWWLDWQFSGPLTNVALAICMSDQFKTWIEGLEKGRFVIMGGCHTSKGNSGMASEFNMWVSFLFKLTLAATRILKPAIFALNFVETWH